MAKIAHYRDLLKKDFLKRITLLADFLSAQDILAAAAAEGYCWRNRIWNPVLTVWTFLVQVLHPGSPCRQAVAQVLAERAVKSPSGISPDASAYCQARRRVPLSVFTAALQQVGRCLQAKAKDQYLWHGRRVRVVDGSSPKTSEFFSFQYYGLDNFAWT